MAIKGKEFKQKTGTIYVPVLLKLKLTNKICITGFF